MLEFLGSKYRSCDGVSRRHILKVGTLGLAGMSLPELLRQRAQAAPAIEKETALILVWLGGGPSHMDMYDLKPDAPREYRGEFNPISTSVDGIQISEHLPRQAKLMEHMAIVRSLTHTNAGHGMASQWLMTGRMPTLEVNDNIYPSTGSIVAKMRGANQEGIPPYVTLPRDVRFSEAAYLGPAYNPFQPGADPNSDSFQVRNVKLPNRVDFERLSDRRGLLNDLDTLRRDLDTSGVANGLDSFYGEAMQMITSERALKAFDIHKEDPRLRERYGRTSAAQSFLLARRLVEAGVTYVTIEMGGWDTHGNNFAVLKDQRLPEFDQALSALIQDMVDRGLTKKVMVMVMGEFGRTPKINGGAGRDHWPGAASVVFAGGGLKCGQVIGSTNSKGEYPASRPCSVGDVLSTMYRHMGIDYTHTFYDAAQRPLAILPEGRPIEELVS